MFYVECCLRLLKQASRLTSLRESCVARGERSRDLQPAACMHEIHATEFGQGMLVLYI